ncbi:L,D-transpeptidase family protein [Taibaiella koreensis]|uniref:L,D-transpeptidase family protein n=1 Tax=Taibaiella koreensis TaxID=1268548 RepID=UPI000E59F4E9|nr:L,D-transpeptidase [Taibaiella koreensis]
MVQKSTFSQAFKRIIFFSSLASACFLYSCQASGADEKPTLQQRKRQALKGSQPALRGPVDSLVVYKGNREMIAFRRGQKVKTYIVSLGSAPEGAKRMRNDNKTPEGLYYIDGKNGASSYHRNLGISYPNAADRRYARTHGLDTGGDIKIHGLPNQPRYSTEDYLYHDWTWGCIAVSNEEVEELYRYVAVGTPILLLP